MKTVIVLCLFALAVTAFFSDVLFGPSVLLDASPYAFHPWRSHASPEDLQYRTYRMDGLLTYLPRQVEVSRSFRSGRFPLWNPYIYTGMPFFADPQTRVIYPVSALLAWMDPAEATGYDVAIHFLIAMVGMYLFLRAVDTTTAGSIVGAFAYGFSSFFYCRVGQPPFVAAASWIPFFFYAYERARRSERTGTLLLIGFLAMGYLAGFPQIFMLGVGGLVIYAIAINVDRMVAKRPTDWLRSLRVLTISGVCSMLLVSVQLVPFLEFIRSSVGLNIEFDKMRDVYQSPPALLLKSFFPDLFGNPVAGTDWSGLVREAVHPYTPDFIIYCGIGCILVALGGLVFARRLRRMRALIVLFFVSIGLATSPLLLRIAYALLPMFRYSRVARVGVLGCFALAGLAGLTISMLSRETDSDSRRPFLRVLLAALAVIIVGGLLFMAAGRAYIDKVAEKARSLGPEFWQGALAQLRSGKLAEWAEGETSVWFAYVRGRLLLGMGLAALASLAISAYAWPRRLGVNLRRAALIGFGAVLLFDLGLTSRGYFVTQPSADFPDVAGIRVLKAALGSPGRWRTRSVSYSPEYVSTLPGNANQILKIQSLEGTSTIVPGAYYDGLLKSFDDAVIPERLRKSYLPFEPEEIRLSDLACVRYVAAEATQAPYVLSPVLRTIVDGLAGRAPDREIVRLIALGDDRRLALRQGLNEAFTFALQIPDVSRLDFAVGFTGGEATEGDSLRFLLMLDGPPKRIEFARAFDLASDRDRWHEVSLDIAAVSGEVIRGAVGVVSSAEGAPPAITAGWSGMDLVFEDCSIDTIPRGYRIDVGGIREFAGLTLRSEAQELPLTFSLGSGVKRIRWVGFPSHMPLRHIAVDLAPATADRILVESDSSFSLEGVKTIHMGSVYPDYQLVHDSDMHIYENFAAMERGVCLDRTMVSVNESAGEPRLALAAMDDMGEARCGRCRIVSYEPERVELDIAAERDCFVLFQDMYYPGWKAYVDEEPCEFIKADVGFRVLEVSGGEHTVVMEFKPGSLKVGLALSCLGLLFTLVYAWRSGSRPEDGVPSGRKSA